MEVINPNSAKLILDDLTAFANLRTESDDGQVDGSVDIRFRDYLSIVMLLRELAGVENETHN
jgi:hypothetical protein